MPDQVEMYYMFLRAPPKSKIKIARDLGALPKADMMLQQNIAQFLIQAETLN